jgi:hypothetical protein
MSVYLNEGCCVEWICNIWGSKITVQMTDF